MAISKQLLSGSTDGMGILVAATASSGTTIHTAHATNKDEIWLWAVNSSLALVKLTIQYGGTTSPNQDIEMGIPPESGLFLVVPGLVLTNSLVVRAFTSTANVLVVHGFVNRIS